MMKKVPPTPILFSPFSKHLFSSSAKVAFLGRDGNIEGLNSNGFRSDEFCVDHNNRNHVLFSGCSYSLADGLYRDESWAWKVWQDSGDTSGFFNLAELGNNIPNIVNNIFKYCDQFGIPDKIYLLLPDTQRYWDTYGESKSVRMVHAPMPKKIDKVYVDIACFQHYAMLEIFCRVNGIDLVSFSWEPETEKLLATFDTFFIMDRNQLEADTYEFSKTMEDKTYALYARGEGNRHPGIAVQHAYYLALKRHTALDTTPL